MNLNLESNLFLYKGKVGDYYLSGGKKVEITKRTNKRIYLSSGVKLEYHYSMYYSRD